MVVGKLVPEPESAFTDKDRKELCPAGHLDLEKQLRQMVGFPSLHLCRIAFICQMEGVFGASKTHPFGN